MAVEQAPAWAVGMQQVIIDANLAELLPIKQSLGECTNRINAVENKQESMDARLRSIELDAALQRDKTVLKSARSALSSSTLLRDLKERNTSQRPKHSTVIFKPKSSFDCCGWLQSLLSPWGRPLRPIVLPMMTVVLVAVMCAVATETELLGGRWELDFAERLSGSYSGLFVAVSFLLVFRLNRASVRYYEARQAAGQMVLACRELASEACCCLAHDVVVRDDLCRWVVAFPVATRNYLRGMTGPEAVKELEALLSPEQLGQLAVARRQPLLCIDHIRQKSLEGTRSNSGDNPHIAAEGLRALNREIEMLQGGMGAMERINATPLPFAYVSHLRSFLLLHLLGMPFVFASTWGWANPVAMAVLSYGLLGIEAVSVTCERPFGLGSNHLTLDRFSDVVAEDVEQTVHAAQGRSSPATTLAGI